MKIGDPIPNGHDGGLFLKKKGKDGHCWYFIENRLILINEKEGQIK